MKEDATYAKYFFIGQELVANNIHEYVPDPFKILIIKSALALSPIIFVADVNCDGYQPAKDTVVLFCHYNDVIMSAMASQITNLTIVYSTVYSGADQRKHQSSASLTFVGGPMNSTHKGPVARKMFPIYDVIMLTIVTPHSWMNTCTNINHCDKMQCPITCWLVLWKHKRRFKILKQYWFLSYV